MNCEPLTRDRYLKCDLGINFEEDLPTPFQRFDITEGEK